MPETIWPFDVASDRTVEPESYYVVRCFVLIRSFPQEVWDDMFQIINSACEQAKSQLQIGNFQVVRATDIVTPGVIHYEIWNELKKADIVIADLTGHNPNVMFELGLAAAMKDKQRVILIREKSEEHGAFPFDMMPARHIVYARTLQGLAELRNKLTEAILLSLLAAPFEAAADFQLALPVEASLDDGHDNPAIWTSDTGHRRVLPDCLEFGSLFLPRYSWASVGNLKLANVRVEAEMRLTRIEPRPDNDHWMGIQLRSQGFYANLGILVHVRNSGEVALAVPTNEAGGMEVTAVAKVRSIDERPPNEFVKFDITLDDQALDIAVDSERHRTALAELPHVYSRGRILFETLFARAGVRRIRVTAPDSIATSLRSTSSLIRP